MADNRPMPTDPKELARAMFRQADRQAFGGVKMSAQQRKKRVKKPDIQAPLNLSQPPLLIEHQIEGETVTQRPRDGYINATRLCKQAGKLFGNYYRNAQTQDFLQELSTDMRIRISDLVQVIKGGSDPRNQGTWVHPEVAIHLGVWLSPKFAVMVSRWVHDWMSGNFKDYMPPHIQRYLKNKSKIPHNYFSMLNEIYLHLLAPLEDQGIVPPDNMMPDASTGKMFSNFLRKRGIDPTEFPEYDHEFIDKSRPTVRARLYPIEHLAAFRKYFHEVWLPERAQSYFEERFPKALPYLPAIKQLPKV